LKEEINIVMVKEKCPSCSAPLEPGAKFCWRCGAKLEPSKGRSKSISNQKERTSILELNDVKKQLDELKKRLDEITPILQQLSKTKENVSEAKENVPIPSQGSVATPVKVPQTPQLTQEQLEQLASKYEVSPEVFEKLPEKELEDYGKKLLLLAQYSADGIIDIGELINYERSKNKDPRVYLPLIEVARYSFYLWEPTPDGKGYKSKVPLLPFEEITWREWSRKYIEKYGCYTGPLEKAYRFMTDTSILEQKEGVSS